MPRKLPANGAKQLEDKIEQLHQNGVNMGMLLEGAGGKVESVLAIAFEYSKELDTEKKQLTDEITKMYRNR